MTLLLSRSDTDGLLSYSDVIEVVESAHADMSRGSAAQPAPASLELPSGSASFIPMAALADRQGMAAVKFLADVPDNVRQDLPMQRSVLVLLSQETGACEAIIDGRVLTRQRTAAASAVAARHLARPDSRVLGLVGAGNLAVEHITALCEVLPIARALVWSRTEATVARFLDQIGKRDIKVDVDVLGSPRDVVAGSDVVCTLTPVREPIVQGDWFAPGLHVNAVGAPPRADHREIDSRGMARAKLIVDSVATALKKSGDVLLAIADGAISEDNIRTELGDVIIGKSPGRRSSDDITLFNSVGIAMQDLAIGNLMLERCRQAGVGTEIDLSR